MRACRSPVVVWIILVAFAVTSTGCGILMHPARRTATPSTKIDGQTLILDCLWLLVGVIPGVVALGVDIYSDTLYYSEDELKAGGDVSINIRGDAPADCWVSLRLTGPEGKALGTPVRVCAAQGEALQKPMSVHLPREADLAGAKLVLAVDGRDQVTWTLQPRPN